MGFLKDIIPKEIRHAPNKAIGVVTMRKQRHEARDTVQGATKEIVDTALVINEDMHLKMDQILEESQQWRTRMDEMEEKLVIVTKESLDWRRFSYQAACFGTIFGTCSIAKYTHQMTYNPNIPSALVKVWRGSTLGVLAIGAFGAYDFWNEAQKMRYKTD
eukprot:698609_1